jgi:hypothetical protein
MSKSTSTFRKNDIKRAIQAAVAAGMQIRRVEIDKEGKIALVPNQPGEAESFATVNEWDEVR